MNAPKTESLNAAAPAQTASIGDRSVNNPIPAWTRYLSTPLLVSSFLLLVTHYVHLKADFPHFSPWDDPARITDEGWYAGAALRHFLSGGWRLPGDFNPAVALPVFPVVVALLFRFTGVSVTALRALNVTFFGASLLTVWVLVRRYSHPLAAAGASFLFACSPFYYAYSRLGTLEPLLVLECLLALLAASSITRKQSRLNYKLLSMTIGILLAAMLFTKTPGLCLYPAIFYLMASRCDFNRSEYLRPIALAGGVAGALSIVYYAIVRRAGLTDDYNNLFAINKARIHGRIILSTMWAAAKYGSMIGPTFYFVAVAAIVLFLIVCRRQQSPLFVAAILGALGYGAFIVYHGWLVPRYYLVPVPLIAIALTLALAGTAQSKHFPVRLLTFALTTALFISCIRQIRTLLAWTRNPSYSYVQAAEAIYRIIDRDATKNRIVLSSVSEQMALLTGESGVFINPDYGTTELRSRILQYQPGWEITFDPVGPQQGIYSHQLVDVEPIFGDDSIHYRLLLYRLTPDQP